MDNNIINSDIRVCPVCNGRGVVVSTTKINPKTNKKQRNICKSCRGRGVEYA